MKTILTVEEYSTISVGEKFRYLEGGYEWIAIKLSDNLAIFINGDYNYLLAIVYTDEYSSTMGARCIEQYSTYEEAVRAGQGVSRYVDWKIKYIYKIKGEIKNEN